MGYTAHLYCSFRSQGGTDLCDRGPVTGLLDAQRRRMHRTGDARALRAVYPDTRLGVGPLPTNSAPTATAPGK